MINFKDKMQYLFNISGLETQKEFTEKVLNKQISPQAFSEYLKSEKKANFQTLQTLIEEIKKYPKFKDLSPSFFFSESNNLTDKNINIAKETGLTDETIQNIKNINKKNNTILSNFITGIDKDFWENLKKLEYIKEYKEISLELEEFNPYNFENFRSIMIKKMNLQDIIFPEKRPTYHDFESNTDIGFPTIQSVEFAQMIEMFALIKDKIKNDINYKIFFDIYDTSHIENQIKYQASEYLTLYMNK